MATPSPLKDIDDKFCLCSICLEQLKEPKLMPCLHRYCKDCLSSIIQGGYDVIKCPECREEIQIPTNGVDGFKTDFYSKSLVEYVQIQQSLKSDEILECYGCSKHLKVAAFCFKCNDFLCKDCHNFHVTNKVVKDHQKHTLSLEDIEAKNITLGQLAYVRDAPRCQTHSEKVSELYCETCNDLPVCIACTYGDHKGHNLHEVKALAKLKREKLAKQLKSLKEIEKDKNPITPRRAKEKLLLNVNTEKGKVIKMHEENDQNIMTKIQEIEGQIQQLKPEKQNREKNIFDSLQRKMEKEIQGVKKKYAEILKEKTIEVTDIFEARENSLKKDVAKLRDKRKRFDRYKQQVLELIEKQLNENMKTIETLSQHFDNIKRRFETLNVMSSSILVSDNDWLAVQCIPDMCTAATNLMKDLKQDFPELTTFTDVVVNYKRYSFGKPNATKISAQLEHKISINLSLAEFGMTSSGDGKIVVSGYSSSSNISWITLIDMDGRLLHDLPVKIGGYRSALCCKFLSQHKVAAVCTPNEIGLYDVRFNSYIKKNISDVIGSWPKDRNVKCVATDPNKNHILVGGNNSRDVYVFDDQLSYLHILTLPEMINWPQDITVSDGHLLVCDYEREGCYETTMDGSESKLVSEFMKPNLEENSFKPISVCTDTDGFVYILWKPIEHPYQYYLVQYNHDGSQILTTRKVDRDVCVVTVLETSQGEKLLLAAHNTHNTHNTQTVYLYDLIPED